MKRFHVFTDFDGTITPIDVGDLLYQTFSDSSYVWPTAEWAAGRISSRECLIDQCAVTHGTLSAVERFADAQQIDPFFPPFVDYCERHEIPLTILSDGMDFYIDRILRRHGLERVPYYANHLRIEGDRFVPEFPHADHDCLRCANCKGPHVRRGAAYGVVTIYIGDGFSDICGAVEADIVFAKGKLLRWCCDHNRPHFAFDGFRDVLNELTRFVAAGGGATHG